MIVLRTKEVEFDVTYINLREKPDWFLKISPHGKVPVLKVDDEILGGMIVSIGDKFTTMQHIDLSTSSKMQKYGALLRQGV